MYQLKTEIYLDKHEKCYKKIIIIDPIPNDPLIKKILTSILKKEKMVVKNFIVKQIPFLSLEGDERSLSVKVSNLKLENQFNDEFNEGKEKIKVSFFLPKSSYPTQAIRQIVLQK